MKSRFTGAAAVERMEAKRRLQAELQQTEIANASVPSVKPTFLNETDETLYYLKEKVYKALIHHTACQTISLSLQAIHKIDIWEVMKQYNVKTPIELYKLMGFYFDENGCFSLYPQ